MDNALFAWHFMKNRDETISFHYNMKSGKRHAVCFSMNLYESFSGVKVVNREELANSITRITKETTAEMVLAWLLKQNPFIKIEARNSTNDRNFK